MKIEFAELIRHRPFQIAWVWEMLCLAIGLYGVLALKNENIFMVAVFAALIPMGIVIVLFALAKKAALASSAGTQDAERSPKSSGDIVQ